MWLYVKANVSFFVLYVHVCVVINLNGIVWFSRAFGVH